MKHNILSVIFSSWRKKPVLAGLCAMLFVGTTPLHAQQRQTLPGHVPAVTRSLQPLGRLPGLTNLSLAIGLPLRNQEALTNLLKDIYDPASTNYHHYLTPEQFTEQFGPTQQDYLAVQAFARTNGLTITALHPNRLLLDVSGPVSNIEQAFRVTMRTYQHPTENRNFYAPDVEPSVPLGLPVLDISGLSNYKLPHPKYRIRPAGSTTNATPKLGSGLGGTYLGNDFRAAYAPGVTLTGAGQTVGLLQFDGYLASDIALYESLAGLRSVPLQNVLLDGFNGVPTGNGGEVEVSLDIEMSISMAPGLSGVIVYEAGPFGFQNDILNRMATDNAAKQISCSWGWGGGPQSTTDQILQQMVAQGQEFFDASGDTDAFPPGAVDDPTLPNQPSDNPYMTQVGGTTLTTTGPGGGWVSETVWNVGLGAGSCGGISSFYPIPIWQQGISMAANQGSTTFRNLPDVALTADNVEVVADNGTIYDVGGTSCASPLWAGFAALANQQAAASGQPPIGFINPAIYNIASGANYNPSFHDTTNGDNTSPASPTMFFAVPGFDLCTGLGTPTGGNLINALAPPGSAPNLALVTNVVSGGNGNGIVDPNECDSFDVVLANVGSAGATGIHATLSTSTRYVAVTQHDSSYGDLPVGATGTNLTHFTVSTGSNFVCGTPIRFTLAVKSDQITRSISFTLKTGVPAPPIRFDNNVSVGIPDADPNGIDSTVQVSGITAPLQKVTVALNILHPFDADLKIQLFGPDGTSVILSQNNGLGADYGIGCSPDTSRTTFDDDATTAITAGNPPFVGSFQPEQPLAAFAGKSGPLVNGQWRLHVVDQLPQNVGTLDCWTLNLIPLVCADGGGRCPGIDLGVAMTATPGSVIVQSNLTYTITVINNGPDTARGVNVSQTLPAGVIYQSGSASQGSVSSSGSLVTASLGNLNVGSRATITVVVTPTVSGTISSTATVGSLDPDFDPSNNSATVITPVKPPSADLAVTLIASPNPVSIGGILTYTATVTNNGPVAAPGTVLTATLPANVSVVSAVPSQGSAALAGNQVTFNLGTLDVGGLATAIIQVRAIAVGGITATASVSSSITDPVPGNNTASISTTIAPSADLKMTMTGNPTSAIYGNNVTYAVTVLNQGPSPATNVIILDTANTNLTYSTIISTSGSTTRTGNVVRCTVPNLAVGGSVTLTIVVNTGNLPTDYSTPQTITNSATVSSSVADPNPANNSAMVTTRVDIPRPLVVTAGALLIAESIAPPNGFVDPGETVTVNLSLQNIGNVSTGNLVATLLATNGVTPVGSQVQSYGAMSAGGQPKTNAFTFTAATNGASVAATLQLQDGSTNMGLVQFVFPFPVTGTFANTGDITIPDHGEASPYPSSINVSGVTGLISKVTVTTSNFNHTYPDDVDMLLVGPGGQSVVLMSHAGDTVATNVSLTFDDSAGSFLPQTGQINSGTYEPSAYELGSVFFPAGTPPALNPPPMPYGTNLSIFNGTNANGTWSLFVFDSSPGDQGIIVGGWQLAISAGTPVNQGGDVSITGVGVPNPVLAGNNLTYTFSVTNNGLGTANAVAFTNVLPAGVNFVSATSSQGTVTTNGSGAVYGLLGSLGTGTNVTITLVVTPTVSGTLTNLAAVVAQGDLNLANNSITVLTAVNAQSADLGVSVSSTPSPAVIGNNLAFVLTVTNSGPGTAFGVVVTNTLNGVVTNLNSPPFAVVSGVATNSLGTLSAGDSVTVVLNVTPAQLGSFTNVASVGSLSSDPNAANNSASNVITVIIPAPGIIGAGARLLTESFVPPNGTIDPGETVTLAFTLTNSGSAGTSNVVATLQAINGVTLPGGPQSYGALTPGGPAVSRNFTFTGNGVNGGVIAATLQLQDGTTNLGTAVFNFSLPAATNVASGSGILIPDHGPGSPYPSTIAISGLTGVISKATVTLSSLSHTFPSDIQVLLVGPSGQKTVLMAGTGGAHAVTNVTLTFDDAAAAPLPASGQIVSGTNTPTDNGLALPFPGPAPAGPYSTALAVFDGSVPNGTWSLYVFDNSPGDSGNVAGGWTLNFTTVSPVNFAADLGITLAGPAGLVLAGGNITYTVSVTNKGPAGATGLIVTNNLPNGVNFVSTSLGSYTPITGGEVFNLANLNPNSATSFTITASAASSGSYTSAVSVGADETDLFPADNAAQLTTTVTVVAPPTLGAAAYANGAFTLRLTGQAGLTYIIEASPDLNTWTPVSTNSSLTGIIEFTDFDAGSHPLRFYRARIGP